MAKTTPVKRNTRNTQSKLGASILRGLDEAIEYVEGKDPGVRVHTFRIPRVDIAELRKKMKLGQAAFAERFGFPLATLRNWEQGRREPELSARILLAVIARHPEAVEDVLSAA